MYICKVKMFVKPFDEQVNGRSFCQMFGKKSNHFETKLSRASFFGSLFIKLFILIYNLYIHIWYHDFFADRCKIVSNEPCHNISSSYSSSLKFHFNAWKKRWGYLVFGKWTTSKKIEVMSWTYVFTSSRYTT